MGALETRAFLHAGGDDYVCPVSERHLPPAVLADDLAPVWAEEQTVTVMPRAPAGGPSPRIAAGCARLAPVTAEGAGPPYSWRERRVVIRACQLAQAAERGLRRRLAKAPAEITALTTRGRGRRRGADPGALREAGDAILARDRVHGLLHIRSREQRWEQPWRRDGHRDTTVRLAWDVQVRGSLHQEAMAAAVRQLGWRVDVTTQPPAQLSLQEAVLAYRNAYLGERAMGRLNGRPLSLTPMDLEREDHATGLIRLLSLGWRGLTRLEFGVRRRVATAKTPLVGLSVGNPKRATAHPTAARLLEAVQGLTLTIIRDGHRRQSHLTPLSRVQRRMLALLNFPVGISTRLSPDSHKPP
jgi:transposase